MNIRRYLYPYLSRGLARCPDTPPHGSTSAGELHAIHGAMVELVIGDW